MSAAVVAVCGVRIIHMQDHTRSPPCKRHKFPHCTFTQTSGAVTSLLTVLFFALTLYVSGWFAIGFLLLITVSICSCTKLCGIPPIDHTGATITTCCGYAFPCALYHPFTPVSHTYHSHHCRSHPCETRNSLIQNPIHIHSLSFLTCSCTSLEHSTMTATNSGLAFLCFIIMFFFAPMGTFFVFFVVVAVVGCCGMCVLSKEESDRAVRAPPRNVVLFSPAHSAHNAL